MRVPVWLTLGVAILVCVFGAYRIRLAFRSDEEDARARAKKGLYSMARRTHFLIGVLYFLLGSALIATSFGWNPLGTLFAPKAPAARGARPTEPAPARPAAAAPGSAAAAPGAAPTTAAP